MARQLLVVSFLPSLCLMTDLHAWFHMDMARQLLSFHLRPRWPVSRREFTAFLPSLSSLTNLRTWIHMDMARQLLVVSFLAWFTCILVHIRVGCFLAWFTCILTHIRMRCFLAWFTCILTHIRVRCFLAWFTCILTHIRVGCFLAWFTCILIHSCLWPLSFPLSPRWRICRHDFTWIKARQLLSFLPSPSSLTSLKAWVHMIITGSCLWLLSFPLCA